MRDPSYFNLSRWVGGDALVGNRTGGDKGDIKGSSVDMLYFR